MRLGQSFSLCFGLSRHFWVCYNKGTFKPDSDLLTRPPDTKMLKDQKTSGQHPWAKNDRSVRSTAGSIWHLAPRMRSILDHYSTTFPHAKLQIAILDLPEQMTISCNISL